MAENSYRRFTLWLLALSLGLSILIIAFNWIVDPLENFDVLKIKGFNETKTEVHKQVRLFKALAIERLKPKAVFLGSSRVMIGLDPADLIPLFQEHAYNSAFAGANFEELYEYFEHTLFHQPDLKMVVIGLDFFAFNKNKDRDFDSKSLNLKKNFSLDCWSTVLFTKTITLDSFHTVKSNMSGNTPLIFLPNGVFNSDLVNDSTTNPILIMGEDEFIRQLLNSKKWYKDYQLCEKRLELFQNMVDTCLRKGIALHVFINPCKDIYWDNLVQSNLLCQMEIWKRKLSAMHTVWDFSGFNDITTDESQYVDCSHYKPQVGRLILASFFGQPSFGYKLTPDTIEQALSQMRSDHMTWKNKSKGGR